MVVGKIVLCQNKEENGTNLNSIHIVQDVPNKLHFSIINSDVDLRFSRFLFCKTRNTAHIIFTAIFDFEIRGEIEI